MYISCCKWLRLNSKETTNKFLVFFVNPDLKEKCVFFSFISLCVCFQKKNIIRTIYVDERFLFFPLFLFLFFLCLWLGESPKFAPPSTLSLQHPPLIPFFPWVCQKSVAHFSFAHLLCLLVCIRCLLLLLAWHAPLLLLSTPFLSLSVETNAQSRALLLYKILLPSPSSSIKNQKCVLWCGSHASYYT